MRNIIEEFNEIAVPLTIEDFEVGERVFHQIPQQNPYFGTIMALRPPEFVEIEFDQGDNRTAHINDFYSEFFTGPVYLRKCLQVNDLYAGCIISTKHMVPQRIYATVVEYAPKDLLVVEYDNGERFVCRERPGKSIESMMANGWQVEG